MADTRQLAKAFKALSNPNRLQIFQEIMRRRQLDPTEVSTKEAFSKEVFSKAGGGCALTDFINSLNVGAPTVSHHIKELVNADLIRVERNGKFITCFLNEDMSRRLKEFFVERD